MNEHGHGRTKRRYLLSSQDLCSNSAVGKKLFGNFGCHRPMDLHCLIDYHLATKTKESKSILSCFCYLVDVG